MADRLEQYLGTGRRKEAVARVYVRPGKGKFVINTQDWKGYMGDRPQLDNYMRSPLKETSTLTKFDVVVNVRGGGVNGQAGAIRMGIARALVKANPDYRPILKKAGFLTRDPRIVERKKFGLHKARRAAQFSKR